jgi:hypothetical protein
MTPHSLDEALADKSVVVTETSVWRGITISVSFDPDWLQLGEHDPHYGVSHLTINVIAPEKAPLPITETGYRSQFVETGVVEAKGGPAAYVLAWLDEAATNRKWKLAEAKWRQLDLFK